jgi:hypothetical protein
MSVKDGPFSNPAGAVMQVYGTGKSLMSVRVQRASSYLAQRYVLKANDAQRIAVAHVFSQDENGHKYSLLPPRNKKGQPLLAVYTYNKGIPKLMQWLSFFMGIKTFLYLIVSVDPYSIALQTLRATLFAIFIFTGVNRAV